MDNETLHLSLAEHQTPYEHHQLPKCYLDMLPEPPPTLPPPSIPEDAQTDSNEPQPPSQQSQVPASLADRKASNWAAMGLGFSDNTLWLASLTMIQANVSHIMS